MNTSTLRKLNDTDKNNLFDNLREYIDISSIQLYNPIIKNFTENESHLLNTTFKNKFTLSKLTKNTHTDIHKKSKTPYLKHFFKTDIYNYYSKKTISKDSFLKISPIINPIDYILCKDSINTPFTLPNFYIDTLIENVNDMNNPCYIDTFYSFLSSKLTETGKCPSFPIYYLSLSCIKKNYKHDITEDYSQIQFNNSFQKNINKLFSIDEIEIDSDSCSDSSSNMQDEVETNNLIDTLLELDTLEDLNETYVVNKVDKSSDHEINDFVKHISANDSFEDIIENNNTFKYCNLQDYPVQLLFTEKLDMTLDDLIESDYTISATEWKSILFQICFGLAVAQKAHDFVHNDLHSSNIMFKKTDEKYLYYKYDNKCFKIPTFGKITKIIDYGRATFKYDNTIYFSAVFDVNGDAEGQYDYPEENSLKNCKVKPNMSFDLARLSTTIIEHHKPNTPIFKLLKQWITDKNGYCLINEEDEFELYITIAKYIKNAVPKKQLTKPLFKGFLSRWVVPRIPSIYD